MDEAFQFIERGLLLLDKYGIGLTVVTLIIVFAVKYGPRLISAHVTFLDTHEKATTSMAANLATLTSNHEASQVDHAAVREQQKESHEMACRCGQHFCDVLGHVGKKLEIHEKIDDSLTAIRRELERVGTKE